MMLSGSQQPMLQAAPVQQRSLVPPQTTHTSPAHASPDALQI
jgi:hypothetical protein